MFGLFCCLTSLTFSGAKAMTNEYVLIRPTPMPLVHEGKEVGTMQLSPGTIVNLVKREEESVWVTRGDSALFKVSLYSLMPQMLASTDSVFAKEIRKQLTLASEGSQESKEIVSYYLRVGFDGYDINQSVWLSKKYSDSTNGIALHNLARWRQLISIDDLTIPPAKELFGKAIPLLESKSESGDPYAQFFYSDCLQYGRGIETNEVESLKWIDKAAASGNPIAITSKARLLLQTNTPFFSTAEGIALLQKAEALGDPEASATLGSCYEFGTGVEKNPQKAFEFYKKAADTGLPYVECVVGNCYFNGFGVTKNDAQSMSWFLRAADENYPDALCAMGWLYITGAGVQRDPQKAFRLYQRAADLGWPRAEWLVADCLRRGIGTPINAVDAVKWYKKAAENNQHDAMCDYALANETGKVIQKNEKEAFRWYQAAAELGFPRGEYCLGNCYRDGIGVEKNAETAVLWYRKAADKGYLQAFCNLGACYGKGLGVPKDPQVAMDWYKKAADKGYPEGNFMMGVIFAEGLGVTAEPKTALLWLNRAVDLGSSHAMCYLARAYLQGGALVPQDQAKAIPLLQRAADAGDADSIRLLGDIYEKGLGVPKDPVEAAKWKAKADALNGASPDKK